MTRACSSCGSSFEAAAEHHRLCWPCWRAERDGDKLRDAYEQGYSGRAAARDWEPLLNRSLLADLIALCHPNRHPPERGPLANRATAALLNLRTDARAA